MTIQALDKGILPLSGTASKENFTLHFSPDEETAMKDFERLCKMFTLSRRVENCSPQTVRTYEFRLGQFARFAKKAPAEITRTDIDSYILHLKETDSAVGRQRSPFTIRSVYVTLRAFYNWMVGEGLVAKSPLATCKVPKVPKFAKEFLTEEQFQRLLSVCPGTFLGLRSRAWLWLLWSTGARFSELANLNKCDLDWDQSRIRVVGKGNKERYVPFTQDAQKAVYRYLGKRQDRLPCLWLTEERQAAAPAGMSIMTIRLYRRAMDHRCDACNQTFAGVDFSYERYDCPNCHQRLRPMWNIKDSHHIFRRTWAYRQLKSGIPMKIVQLVGGWESIAVLEQYVRYMDSEDALDGNYKFV